MKYVIDSSVFVAAFREEELHSQAAFRVLEKVRNGSVTAYLPVSVVIEVVAAIRRRTGNSSLAVTVGEMLLTLPDASFIDLTTFRMGRYLALASEIGLAGMDVIVVGAAQEFDVPLITLDTEIVERGKQVIKIARIDTF